MTNCSMTVHEALAELKVLDSRITKKMVEAKFALTNKANSDKVTGGKKVSTVVAEMNECYQSIMDLIARRNAIKAAISRSNAETKVIINGKEYTVAEAIEMKRSGLQYLCELVRTMNYQNDRAKTDCEKMNTKAEERVDQQIETMYGKEGAKSSEAASTREALLKQSQVIIVAMDDIDKKIAELDNNIDAFTVEVDSKLSISNALTVIEFSY